jgi:cell fate regulator YaaT (PSP1 superfamily)
MGEYHDNHRRRSEGDSGGEEDLGHLEDGHDEIERDRERERPRGKAADPRELPKPLYRIKATHSNETFYAYFPKDRVAAAAAATAPQVEASAPLVEESAPLVEANAPLVEANAPLVEANAVPEPGAEGTSAEAPAPEAAPDNVPESAAAADEASATDAAAGEGAEVVDAATASETPDADTGPIAAAETAPSGILPSRTMVVVPTRYGRDVCELQGVVNDPGQVGRDEIVAIERIATQDDLRKTQANRERERKAFETCKQKIAARNLPMKLVSAHYLLEEPKVLFYFSAESRVDFRELVKDLVAVFKIRIELRQIGVRDEARVTGGCGVCGRVLCCHGVTDKLVPVSIKMAKDQNLSLNSMKISGPCGRLLCCLAYEYGFYRDARRELPPEGARFQYDGVLFRVIEVNALSLSVKISGEDGRILDMPAARFTHGEGRWQVTEDPEAKEKEKEKEKGKE